MCGEVMESLRPVVFSSRVPAFLLSFEQYHKVGVLITYILTVALNVVMAPGLVFPVPFPARTGPGRVGPRLFPSRPGNGPGQDSLLIPGQYHIVPVPTYI